MLPERRYLVLLLLLCLLLAAPVLAQISVHYDLGWTLFSGGGGSRSSAQFQIDDVLSQGWDGVSRSARYQIAPGFWPAARPANGLHLYLPVVVGQHE
jgi:hypothetical protein